jgi:hypothetical protein
MAHDGRMLYVFALVVLALGVWFWTWLFRWASDVRNLLGEIAEQGRRSERQDSGI